MYFFVFLLAKINSLNSLIEMGRGVKRVNLYLRENEAIEGEDKLKYDGKNSEK